MLIRFARIKMFRKFPCVLLFSLLVAWPPLSAQVRLPKLISDGVVLQRDAEVNVWGWASPGEHVSVQFLDSIYRATANNQRAWELTMPPLKAGGPYDMLVRATNEIMVSNVLIGDVWICSGQSNMELSMKRVSSIYVDDIARSGNPFIRQFTLPQRYDFNTPQQDLPGGVWKSANPENILEFSAVAYFFAKELYDANKVPVGLIQASLGGSPAEAWLCEEALKMFPAYYGELQQFKDSALIRRIESGDNTRIGAWYRLLRQKDEGYKYPAQTWLDPALDTHEWSVTQIPGYWANTSLGPVNGVVWFWKNIGNRAISTGSVTHNDSHGVKKQFINDLTF